jgi:predicted phosphodiesterase
MVGNSFPPTHASTAFHTIRVIYLSLSLAIISLTIGCRGFVGTSHRPWGSSIETSRGLSAGPWLSPLGSTGALALSWFSPTAQATALWWGVDAENLSLLFEPQAKTLHRVVLDNLIPGGRYFYRLATTNAAATNVSTTHAQPPSQQSAALFQFTAPDFSAPQGRVLIVGDTQVRNQQTRRQASLIAQGLGNEHADLIIQLGDMVEIGGLHQHWQQALAISSTYAATKPMFGVIGNHDYFGDPGRNFRTLFPYPYSHAPAAYYSFQFAGALFAMVDSSEDNGRISPQQQKWLANELAKAADLPFRFIFLHHTVLSSGTSAYDQNLVEWLIPLADTYRVSAVIYGHDHHYEHWSVAYGADGMVFQPAHKPNQHLVHYLCAGGGGAMLEPHYGLLARPLLQRQKRLYHSPSGRWLTVNQPIRPWSRRQYQPPLSLELNGVGPLLLAPRYYQLPAAPGSATGTPGWPTYHYGEQTIHYLSLDIKPTGAIIQAHYPNGSLIQAPGSLAQPIIISPSTAAVPR